MSTNLRALVMLLVLVGGPITWMTMGPLPEEAQHFVAQLISTAKNKVGFIALPSQKLHKNGIPQPVTTQFENKINPVKKTESKYGVHLPQGSKVDKKQMDRPIPLGKRYLEQFSSRGVDSYKLEPWGKDEKLFRFCCDVTFGHSHDLTRQFEEVNENPDIAIQNVMQEIDSWRQYRFGLQ